MTGVADLFNRLRITDLPVVRRCALLAVFAIGLIDISAVSALGQASLKEAFTEAFRQAAQSSASAANEQAPADSASQTDEAPAGAAGEPRAKTSETPQDSANEQTETLPEPRMKAVLPLADNGDGEVQLSASRNGRITLIVRDASLSRVIALLAQEHNLNIVAANDIDAVISITLRDVPLEEALSAILSVANYTWVKRNNIILITSLTNATPLPADVQGRQFQVFDLDFAKASNVAEAVTNFLSPVGKVTVAESSPSDNRLTQERIVVEDTPESLARIAAFICQVDRAPRQVQIEAHVFEVQLSDNCQCGVNLDALVRISGSNLNLATTGFANPDAPSAFLATLDGGDLGGVIEALQTTTDLKTLGSPKVLVLNEQEARIQVGDTIYYTQTTTTETSSQQGAASIETGVILHLIPRITRDGRVLLHVAPEISSAGERQTPELPPDTRKTQLETDVMLEDGQGMIIGGLIRETDSTVQNKVPYLGEVKGIGWLFRKSEVKKERKEVIIALVPRIQPYDVEWASYEQGELARAGTPLFEGPLKRTYRPWEPILPDGKRIAKPLVPKKQVCQPMSETSQISGDYIVPPRPMPQQRFCNDGCDVVDPVLQLRPGRSLLTEEVLPMQEVEGGAMEILTDQ